MKVTIGTDIIEVDRIKNAMELPSFSIRVFTDQEIAYCESKSESTKYQHYAARFAGKEAIFKALSQKLSSKYDIEWKNIEILNDKSGKPTVNLIGTNIKNVKIDVSLSHIKEYAVASAIVTMN